MNNLIAYIRHSRRQRNYLFVAAVASVLLIAIFKRLYPYPNLVLDSYYYIKAAVLELSVNAWPIGYSKFLQIFGYFSHSAYWLVIVQYVLLELSLLIFFFTWQFLYRPGVVISHILFILLFLNPLYLYCCNYILADGLFITLSILWVTQLLWIICQPRPYMILTQALLLLLVFSVRYNALYYPIIGAIAFLLSRQSIWQKITGIGLPFCLVCCFVYYSSGHVAIVTGERQFSPFGGWKLANDALYGYANVPIDRMEKVPPQFRVLDSTVRAYFQRQPVPLDLLKNDSAAGSFYMFQQSSPLVIYMEALYGGGPPFLNKRKWLMVAPLYQSYGSYLIRKYPSAFARYFLWPNLIRYCFPPGEIFGSSSPFHFFESFGGQYCRKLLGLNTLETKAENVQLSIDILSPFSNIFTIFHLVFVFGFFGFLFFGGFKKMTRPVSRSIILVMCLWVADLCFSVFSAGVVLRYEIFMIVLEMAFSLYFVQYIYYMTGKVPETNKATQLV